MGAGTAAGPAHLAEGRRRAAGRRGGRGGLRPGVAAGAGGGVRARGRVRGGGGRDQRAVLRRVRRAGHGHAQPARGQLRRRGRGRAAGRGRLRRVPGAVLRRGPAGRGEPRPDPRPAVDRPGAGARHRTARLRGGGRVRGPVRAVCGGGERDRRLGGDQPAGRRDRRGGGGQLDGRLLGGPHHGAAARHPAGPADLSAGAGRRLATAGGGRAGPCPRPGVRPGRLHPDRPGPWTGVPERPGLAGPDGSGSAGVDGHGVRGRQPRRGDAAGGDRPAGRRQLAGGDPDHRARDRPGLPGRGTAAAPLG